MYGGGMSPDRLWKDLRSQLINKLKDDHTFMEHTEHLMELPVKFLPPTGYNKYVEWVVKSYIKDGIEFYSDLDDIYPAIHEFKKLVDAKKLSTGDKTQPWTNETDINIYCGLNGCIHKGRNWPGLNYILSKHAAPADDMEKLKTSRLIYESEQIKVYQPTTASEACYYGRGTKWCTAAKNDNSFESYKLNDGPMDIIVPKHPDYIGEKYQIQLISETYMNELDEPITWDALLSKFPDLVDFIGTYYNNHVSHNEIHLFYNNGRICRQEIISGKKFHETYWYNDKKQLHRTNDRPAHVIKISNNKKLYWYRNGKHYRSNDKPDIVNYYNNKVIREEWSGKKVINYFKNGMLRKWYKGSSLHRDGNLPAFEYIYRDKSVAQLYFNNGDLVKRGPVRVMPELKLQINKRNTVTIGVGNDLEINQIRYYTGGKLHSINDYPAEISYSDTYVYTETWYDHGRMIKEYAALAL